MVGSKKWASRHHFIKVADRVAQPVQLLGNGLDDQSSIPGRGKGNFFLYHRVQTGSGAHSASYKMSTGGKARGASN
jgi:hypothetical protein